MEDDIRIPIVKGAVAFQWPTFYLEPLDTPDLQTFFRFYALPSRFFVPGVLSDMFLELCSSIKSTIFRDRVPTNI